MPLIKCTYTTQPGCHIPVGAVRYVNRDTGTAYEDAGGTRRANSGFYLRVVKGTATYVSDHSRGVLTPVEETKLPESKQCPIRSLFTAGQIESAYASGLKRGAELLSGCTDNGRRTAVTVSRQLFRFWCIDLGLHVPKSQRKAEPKLTGKPKILLIDIETAPILGYVWSLWKQNVGLNQIKEEWYILSYCAKWLGESEIIYRDVRNDPHSDASLLPELWELLNEADIIIGQNGKAFDIPKIQARMVMAGMLPPRPFKVIDTLLMAKQQFRFTSNRLEWMTGDSANLTEISKSKHAKFPGFALWAECLKGNVEAWDEMREYNVPDVTSMEELYLRLRPWYVGHPNLAAYVESEEMLCPRCLSTDIKQDGFTFTQTGKYEMYTCGGCGGWSRGRYTKNTTGKRKALLTN